MTTECAVPTLPARLFVVDDGATTAGGSAPRVLLVTEGTYPFAWGGVSTWCDLLVKALPDVDFDVFAIIADPDLRPVFTLPPNVGRVVTVPLWGVHDVKEVVPTRASLLASRAATTERSVTTEFVPALRGVLQGLLTDDAPADALAEHFAAIYRFLRHHDLTRAMRVPQVWDACTEIMTTAYAATGAGLGLPELELWELTTGVQWLQRWLFPLVPEIPRVDVVHAAMAGTCSIVAAAAKAQYGSGFFLTEHGVYLRERYIAEAQRSDSFFLKFLGIRFARRITEMSYAIADQISPCCDYNQRWERRAGAQPHQLETIYYGIDSESLTAKAALSPEPRTIVWLGRINPLKDVETLLRASALVIEQQPDTRFLLYGTAPAEDAAYHERCLALHADLGLADSVTFCGFTNDPAGAFSSGDLVVLSSISEGFPYSTLEAMLCGRPVVATSVGGLPEQIHGAGIAVEPRNPRGMADAILEILGDPLRCTTLGMAARERASTKFGLPKFRELHRSAYLALSPRHRGWHVTDTTSPAASPARETPSDALMTSHEIELVAEVASRTTAPLDSLEIAAIIESLGVTDAVAQRDFGQPDAFALADRMFHTVVERKRVTGAIMKTAEPRRSQSRARPRMDAARYPAWTLLPSAALLATIAAFTGLEHWTGQRLVALTVGMSAGMLSTNGLALAMSRRACVVLALGKYAAARRFFLAYSAIAVTWTAVAATAVSMLPWRVVQLLQHNRLVFVGAAVALSAIWLCASALSLVWVSGWTGIALACGLALGILTDRAAAVVWTHHVATGVVVGVVGVLVVMVWALDRAALAMTGGRGGGRRLPSVRFLLWEAFPHLCYGSLGVGILVAAHAIGWDTVDGDRLQVSTIELGLFLPLVPAVLAAGAAERTLREFWVEAAAAQRRLLASAGRDFGTYLYRAYRRELRGYARRLVLSSILTAGIVEVALDTHFLRTIVPYANDGDVRMLFLGGLMAYGFVAVAQFNCMIPLSFLRYAPAVRWVGVALVVTVAAAYVLASVNWALVGVALAVGAAVYAVGSFRTVRPVLARADHHFVTTV